MKTTTTLQVGQKFGRLTVTEIKGSKFSALCDCGNTHTARHYFLFSGGIRSCGCLQKELLAARSKGDSNHMWKGEDVQYKSAHARVQRERGKPMNCEECGRSDPPPYNGFYEWANMSGNYSDVSDYRRMCRPCHRSFDHSERNFKLHVTSGTPECNSTAKEASNGL